MCAQSAPGGAEADSRFSCPICAEEVPRSRALALACGHFVCDSCWGGYLETCAADAETGVSKTCMEHKCPVGLTREFVRRVAGEGSETYRKYSENMLKNYVVNSSWMKWSVLLSRSCA